MSVGLTGQTGCVLKKYRMMLANCAALRTWLGAADVAAAEARMQYYWSDPPADLSGYPLFTIDHDATVKYDQNSGGSGIDYRVMMTPIVYIQDVVDVDILADYQSDTPTEHILADAFATFMNLVDGVLVELQALAGTDEYLHVEGWTVEGPEFNGIDTVPPVFSAAIVAEVRF